MAQTLSEAIAKHIGAEPSRIAQVAKEGHARIMATPPKPSDFVRRVDGVRDAPEEAVRPNGVIIYTYARLQPIVDYALEVLRQLSPVDEGEYRDAHTLHIGGATAVNASGAMPGETVYILNPVPYARKIESGRMKMRVPGSDHVYERAAVMLKLRFGNQAWIKFTYQSELMSYVPLGGPRSGRIASPAKRSAHNIETATRMPALSIRLM